MVEYKTKRLIRIGLLAALFCLLAAAVLGGATGNAAPGTFSNRVPCQAGSNEGACYTIDSSRPEWLGNWTAIYLPVITKSYVP